MADRFIYRGKDLTGAPGLLSGLADVNISQTPTDKQILLFDSTSGKWKPHTITAADVPYDSDNTVEDKISTLDTRVSLYSFGTYVDIISYTSSNRYTLPSDGYIVIRSGDNVNEYITVSLGSIDITTKTQQTNYTQYNCVFVKKGMRAFVASKNGTNVYARFVPLKEAST